MNRSSGLYWINELVLRKRLEYYKLEGGVGNRTQTNHWEIIVDYGTVLIKAFKIKPNDIFHSKKTYTTQHTITYGNYYPQYNYDLLPEHIGIKSNLKPTRMKRTAGSLQFKWLMSIAVFFFKL